MANNILLDGFFDFFSNSTLGLKRRFVGCRCNLTLSFKLV